MQVYIYIYVYMDEYVWICVCVHKMALECQEDISLSILARRLHKELYPWKPTRPKEKDEGHQSRVRLQGSHLGVRLWSMESRHRAMKTKKMKSWVSIFGGCVGFLLSYYDSNMNMLIVILFFFVFFIQPVKCQHSQVWEKTMGSTPLDEQLQHIQNIYM